MKKLFIILFFIFPILTNAQISYGLNYDDTDNTFIPIQAFALSGTANNFNSVGLSINFLELGFSLLSIQTIQIPLVERSTGTGHFGNVYWALWENGLFLEGGTNVASGTIERVDIPLDTDFTSTNTPYVTLEIPSTSLGGELGTYLYFWRDIAPSGQGNGNYGFIKNNETSSDTSPAHHIGTKACGSSCNYLSWSSSTTVLSTYDIGDIPVLFSQEAIPEQIGNINIISPENATTTASTTIDIEIQYTEATDYTALVYKIYNILTFENLVEYRIIPIGTATGTYSVSTTLDIGNYKIESYLIDIDNNQSPITTNTFSVVENPLGEIFGFDNLNYDEITGLATTTCSISNISGCFQNALVFAFYPSPSALQNFGNLKATIEKKAPFGYFLVLTDTIQNLGSTTPVFALASENNITTNLFSPLRTGMTWLLWFVFGFWLYKRLTHLNI